MESIYFFDLNNSGHHWSYNYNLLLRLKNNNHIVYITANLTKEQELKLQKNNIKYKEIDSKILDNNSKVLKNINYFIVILKVIIYLLRNRTSKLVVLYLDDFIYQISSLRFIFKIFNIKLYAVLHWYRTENKKEHFLKRIVEYSNNTIIVHTDYIKEKIIGLNELANVELIEYPMCHDITKNKNIVEKRKIKILHFGGTRLDKGIDILLDALKLNRESIELTIAGKASEEFNEEYIKNEILKLCKHEIKLDLKFISDEEANRYFNDTDIVILPYRKHFNGESGVFIQALTYGKPLIVPNIIHFPNIINKFNNGVVFECENKEDLAQKIDILVRDIEYYKKNAEKYSDKFRDIHSLDNFIDKYRRILIDLK